MSARWPLLLLLFAVVAGTWPFKDVNVALDRVTLSESSRADELDCDGIAAQISVGADEKMLAHGSAKGVWIGRWSATQSDVIVKRPIRHTRFANKGFNESYMVDVMVREATVLRNLRLAPHVASRLVGSCIGDFNRTVNVVEFMDSLQALIQGAALSWRQRVDVGVRLAQLLDALDRFEPFPLLLCDFTVRQFGVTLTDRRPKLVDVDSLTPYRVRYAHEAERACNRTHPHCASPLHAHCFGLLAASHADYTEFQCQFADDTAADGFCHGFDKRTHVLALGKLLLEDLLVRYLRDAPNAAFETAVRALIDMCTRPIAARRLSLLQVVERLKALHDVGAEPSVSTARNAAAAAFVTRPAHQPPPVRFRRRLGA